MVEKGTVFWLRLLGTHFHQKHENINIVFTIKTYILLPVMLYLSARGGRGKKKWLSVYGNLFSSFIGRVWKKGSYVFVFHTVERLWKRRCHMRTVLVLEQRVAAVQSGAKIPQKQQTPFILLTDRARLTHFTR